MKKKEPAGQSADKQDGVSDARPAGRPNRISERKLFACVRPVVASARPIYTSVAKCLLLALLAGVGLRAESGGYIGNSKPLFPGGVSPYPVLDSVSRSTNGLLFKWHGLSGPYQTQFRTDIVDGDWSALGKPGTNTQTTVPIQNESGFFRVAAPAPDYAGANACASCHSDTFTTWKTTAHASALFYTNKVAHLQWTGVQCENCHGPAGRHISAQDDPTQRPLVTVAAQMCGGCHSGYKYPYFENWAESGHATVTPDVASSILTGGEARMNACGPCHSGAVRLALLSAWKAKQTPRLPTTAAAASDAVTCAVCHDPHDVTANGAQLRNPVASTNFFSYRTSDTFANQYDPNLNLCAQCHNARGAIWQDTSRPPHHSPQYNMLLGNIGVLNVPAANSRHSRLDTQCVRCHLYKVEPSSPTPAKPRITGHSFEPGISGCQPCHSPNTAEARIEVTQDEFKQLLAGVKAKLDAWALSKAPAALRAKYGALAWEYNNPGALSNPGGDTTLRGPTTQEQAGVPDAIKKARFNLYLVLHDGSYGVHNGTYARLLLQEAADMTTQLLNNP